MNIKNKFKFRIVISSVILVIGIILCIVGLAMGAVGDYKKNLALNNFEANVTASNIFNLDIDVSIADVNVICSNDVDDFYISANNITKDFLEYSTSNNTLKLTYDTKKWYQAVLLPGYWKSDGIIEIYIPAKIRLKDVEITAEYGNTRINYLNAERIFIDCGNNDNHIKDINCSYAEINNNKGDVNAVNINSDNIDLNFNYGSAVFSNFVSDSVIIKNKKSNLQISGMITGDSSIQTDGGDVNLTLYGEKSDYNFKVLDGSPTVDDEDAEENKKGKYLFKLNGDINIKIK